jgi:hypothetical protein
LIEFHVNTEYFFLKISIFKDLHPKKLFMPAAEWVP